MYAKKILNRLVVIVTLLMATMAYAVDPLYLKQYDLQPYYYAQIKDPSGTPVSISGATIYCTMKSKSSGAVKINRQTTGINITDAANGQFEYRWQSTDTNTVDKYYIEFEIVPSSGGKYTVPAGSTAQVEIKESLDTQ